MPEDRAGGLVLPLRITTRRFVAYGVVLATISAIIIVGVPGIGWADFPQFWYAGHLVGTPDLLDPARQEAWQAAHGYKLFAFLYPPSTAWLYAPLALLPIGVAFFVHALLVALAGMAAGVIGARAFGLDPRVGLMAALAWGPTLLSAVVGHNAAFAMLLAMVAIWALRRDRPIVVGVAVAAMLFKPTLALPLLALLVLRRQWKALAASIPVGLGYYLAGVAGSAGEWLWPIDWLRLTGPRFDALVWVNANKTVSLPEFAIAHGLWPFLAYAMGAAIVVAAMPRLLRVPIWEAAAAASAIGILVSPHSLHYETVMLLPLILWAAGGAGTGIAEPWRSRLVVSAYLLAPLYIATSFVGTSIFLPMTAAFAAIWISGWHRQSAEALEGPAVEPGY